MRFNKTVLTLLLVILLQSCTSTAPTALPVTATPIADYTSLMQNGGRLFTLNPATSKVRIYAFRAGRAGKLGHNHVLTAPQFSGFYVEPSEGAGRFALEFRLDQLEFDHPADRLALGAAFASTITPDAIVATRAHMLGIDNFQADTYPLVSIRSLQISGEAPKFAARVQIDMHGQTREMWLPLTVEGLPEKLRVQGALVLKQSDFGVKPYSVFGGLLAVQDEVVIEFELVGDVK